MIWRCDLVPQYETYKDEIDQAINRVLYSGRYILSTEVMAFEEEFSAYIGVRFSIGVNSGTDALILSLLMCNIQEGDEVITTPFTAIPTYAAIRHVGARPVFVDIEPDTFLLDLNKVKEAITERTKAVVPVHLFGNSVDIELLRKIVGPNIFIVEDCAQAHGAEVRRKKVGSLGDFGAFSFYPTKNLGGYGDGGIITTNNQEAADKLRKKRMYGMINKDEFIFDGINSRLDELQAAILRVKLKHLDSMNKRRSELADLYCHNLPAEYIKAQVVRQDVKSVHHVYCVLCREHRDELINFLESKNIQANIYYPKPLYSQEGFKRVNRANYKLPNVEEVAKKIIALPFYPEITNKVLLSVTERIIEFYGEI